MMLYTIISVIRNLWILLATAGWIVTYIHLRLTRASCNDISKISRFNFEKCIEYGRELQAARAEIVRLLDIVLNKQNETH